MHCGILRSITVAGTSAIIIVLFFLTEIHLRPNSGPEKKSRCANTVNFNNAFLIASNSLSLSVTVLAYLSRVREGRVSRG